MLDSNPGEEDKDLFLLETCLCALKMCMQLRNGTKGCSSCKTFHVKCNTEILKSIKKEK